MAESLKLYSTGQCPVFQGVFGMGYSKRRALPYVVKLKAFSQKFIIETCKDPSKECFEGGDFNKDINDDWFILSALKSGYDIQNIVVISSDNNLLLKAKENGLVHRKMPETYLIKEELSEEEKEIKALKQELE